MNELWEELIKPKHKLLDIGCWDGSRILKLKDKCDVYGIDIDEINLNQCKNEIKNKLCVGDINEELEFDIKFDFILLRDVLEHLDKDKIALENINKAMKKDGYLILSTPKHIPFFNYYDPAWIRWKLSMEEPHRHYKKEDLFELLETNGFEIKHYHIEGTIKWIISRWINGFLKYVLKSKKQIKSKWQPGYFNWMIVARKIR